jgi:hypothetical protein
MAELAILAGVSAIGYLLNQESKQKKFINNNSQHINKISNVQGNFGNHRSCADSFPVYSPNYVQHQQQVLSNLPNHEKTNNSQKKINKQFEEIEDFSNFIPSNDPTSDMLLDIKERPLTDFFHNNMVPFYKGDGTGQNMAGTGIASGSYVDGIDVDSGFDDSTPWKTQLGNFTGLDDTYLHKREVGPMFSPAEQQTGWVYGTPLFRPDTDQITQNLSNIRNDLRPVEPEMVGPGINLDPSIPASGGFHDFTRILPNNVGDYKKNQLEGQVILGKFFSSNLPTAYPGIGISNDKEAPGVSKNRPDKFWDQSRYPTMTTKVGFQNNFDYNIPEFSFLPNNATRDQTSYGLGNTTYEQTKNGKEVSCTVADASIGTGPLGSRVPLTGQRSETYMSQDNNVRSKSDCNSVPTGAPERSKYGHGNIMANWYVNETDRGTVNPQNVEQLNLMAEKQGTTFYTYDDLPKTRMLETTQYSYAGNAARQDMGTKFYTYEDLPDTTMKETTVYSYSGNVARPDMGKKFYTYEDVPGTTTKETTQYSYVGTAGIPGRAETNRFMFS